jgi:uncharacterized protein YukE
MAELEPLLPYDTGAMRALAQTLKTQAGTLASIADEISGAARSLVFDGPAGDRVRTVLATSTRTVNGVAQRLNDAAARVLSSAEDVDRQNAAIRAHNDAVLRSLPGPERKLIQEGV